MGVGISVGVGVGDGDPVGPGVFVVQLKLISLQFLT
jgi:hypothetical protein